MSKSSRSRKADRNAINAADPTRLHPQHAELLRDAGVAPDVARERGYRSAHSPRVLAGLGFAAPQRRAPALVVPIRGASGRIALHRIRPDLPRERFGTAITFETPRGKARGLDVPLRCRKHLRDASVPLHLSCGPNAALDVDAAVSRGLCCIGVASAAAWEERDGTPLRDWDAIALKGRDVLVEFDAGSAGRPHARAAIAALAALLGLRGARVRVNAPAQETAANGRATRTRANGNAADALVAIGARTELFHDERREPYAVIGEGADGARRRAVRVRGRDFRLWLRHEHYRATRGAVNEGALGNAVEALAAKALFEGKARALPLRFGGAPPEVWVDLADDEGRAVRVTPRGFETIETPPVLFRRFSHQLPLPVPAKSGKLAELAPFLNLARAEDALLVSAWLVAAMLPQVPCPALCLHGPQGSAKTTQARMLRSLLDPSSVESLDLGQSSVELAQNLDHHAVPLFDNLSRLNQRQADFLCRAVTGGGFSKRELFSNDDDVLFSFRRPMLLTGVNVPAVQSDLLDRMLLIELRAITPETRRPEKELRAEFEKARPRIFAGMLSAMAAAMNVERKVKLKRSPRMADFAKFGAAVAVALGRSAAEFEKALEVNADRQAEVVVEGNELVEAIGVLVKKHGGRWSGTAKELLERIGGGGRRGAAHGWPVNAWALSQRITELEVPLRRVGFVVERVRAHEGRRMISIEAASPASPSIRRGKRARKGDLGGETRETRRS